MSKAPPWYCYLIALALLPIAFWIVGETVEHFTPPPTADELYGPASWLDPARFGWSAKP